jgi:hypothetical protein
MKDPVALAYSGRIPEAIDAALAQASSDDDFLVAQALEALAVLGQQHGLRTNAALDRILVQRSGESPSIARKAFEAAMGVGSSALEPVAAHRLEAGQATWDVLRYAGEWPSHRLGRALLAGWERLPRQLLDEALLTSCAMPVANPEEAREFGRRAMDAARERDEELRAAGFVALKWWIPLETADICAQSLTDDSQAIRQAAAELLATLDPERLIELAQELGEPAREVQSVALRTREELLRRAMKKAPR